MDKIIRHSFEKLYGDTMDKIEKWDRRRADNYELQRLLLKTQEENYTLDFGEHKCLHCQRFSNTIHPNGFCRRCLKYSNYKFEK